VAKIGLIDVDGHNFPNLALMKISAYHKSIGDTVQWYDLFGGSFDIVYKAKVFTFTPDYLYFIDATKVINGGTGYDYSVKIPYENIQPDYTLYPKFTEAYGFLTRGCIRNCKWCLVPSKEGKTVSYMDIDEVAQDKKEVILMDNNILSCDYGIEQLKKIATKKIRIDFNQGLDARLITPEIAELLAQIKWIRYIRLSCDSYAMLKVIKKTLEALNDAGIKNYRIFVYVLLYDLQDNYNILTELKKLGVCPFSQPFRDFTPKQIIPQWQLDMAQWTNKRSNFMSCDYKEYKPRKNFCCNEYFNLNGFEKAKERGQKIFNYGQVTTNVH
jgi:hypothetical protein